MKFKITIIEFNGEGKDLVAQARYEQTIDDNIDLHAVIAAVNRKPRLRRRAEARSQKSEVTAEPVP